MLTDKPRKDRRKTATHAIGYLIGWMILAAALMLGSRILRLGHGFGNPLPYIAIAFLLALSGRMLRKWLG